MRIYKYNINNLSDEEYERYRMHMENERRERLDKLRFFDDRKRSLCGYMLAIKALSEISATPESDIIISYDKNGKPYSNTRVCFSISHSGEYAVCAVDEKDIGIDIERVRSVNMESVRKFATESESVYIFGHTPSKADFKSTDKKILERFFEVWTKKEAYGKMCGVGLDYDRINTEVKNAYIERMGEYVIAVCSSNAGR